MYARYYPPSSSKEQGKPAAPAPVASTTSSTVTSRGVTSGMSYARYIPLAEGKTSEPVIPVPTQPRRIVFDDDDFPTPEPKKRKRNGEDEGATELREKKSKNSKKRDEKETAVDRAKEKTRKSKKSKKSKVENTEDEEKRANGTEDGIEKGDNLEVEEGARQGDTLHKEPDPDSAGLSIEHTAEKAEPTRADPETAKEKRKPKKQKEKKKKAKESASEICDEHDSADEIRKRHKSVFEKRDKALQARVSSAVSLAGDADVDPTEPTDEDARDRAPAEPAELHGLEPIPQPEQPPDDNTPITYETLPPWLASPIRVVAGTTAPFADLGIPAEAASILGNNGFKEAFAVQTAVIPLLLPSSDRRGDLVVSAATGSGKTLAYVLPMVHDISRETSTKLRGLIVLPTRDLVQQVKTAYEACAAAFAGSGRKKINIGTAMGNKAFRDEQVGIMDKMRKYDPTAYREQRIRVEDLGDSRGATDDEGAWHFGGETVKTLPDHVIRHFPKVDILVCTPGRLVDHINLTPGFTLDYVRWLVVDEADKLLAQDYQQWLSIVMKKLSTERLGARDFANSNYSGVRKVILSATMTRDLGVYSQLKLRRPSIVVLDEELQLPPLLKESAIRVRDSYYKTLYLVDLLRSEHMVPMDPNAKPDEPAEPAEPLPVLEQSEAKTASSDDDTDSSSSDSSSDSEPETRKPASSVSAEKSPAQTLKATVLIFTQSNEFALRLARLLALLAPDLAPLIGTLTSVTKTARRARTLHAFARGTLRILVASDLVARGIDLAALDHVVNYDVPATTTAYIHRVGRTARAGRAGHAWTLVEHAHALRFWRDFAGEGAGKDGGAGRMTGVRGASGAIVRSGVVERVRLYEKDAEFSEERKKAYERALERLDEEVRERRRK